jgi:hypothetical protein
LVSQVLDALLFDDGISFTSPDNLSVKYFLGVI